MGDGLKSGGADQKVIPKYLGDLHVGVCVGPVRAVTKIVLGDRLLTEHNFTQSKVINVNDSTLFGGLEREGGVLGSIFVLLGHDTQILPLALAKIIDQNVTEYGEYPSHRGMVTLFFSQLVKAEYNGALIADLSREDIFDYRHGTGFYWQANNRAMRPIKVEVVNYAGENEEHAAIPRNIGTTEDPVIRNDANPAYIIRDLMIKRAFGAGIAQPHFNEASFREAAAVLASESLGITYKIMQSAEISKLINDILRHIDAMCFDDLRTGQMNIRLLRHDPDNILTDKFPIAGPHNSKVTSFKIQGEELINQLDITYSRDVAFKNERIEIDKDRNDLPIYRNIRKEDTDRDDTVTVQDIAGMTSDSGVVSESRSYLGIRNPALAQRVAERDLLAAAYPMAYIEMDLFNDFALLSPGDILKVNSPEDSPDDPDRLFIMRVMNITESLNGGQTLRVNLAEDVYSRSKPPEYAVPVGEIERDNNPPTNDYENLAITLPYIILARAGIYDPDFVHFGMLVWTEQQGVNDFYLTADGRSILGNATEDNLGVAKVVGKGVLFNDLPAISTNPKDLNPISTTTIPRYYPEYDAEGLTGRNKDLLAVSNPGLVPIDSIIMIFDKSGVDEMVGIQAINDDGTITLWRGLFDTIPRNWPVNTEFVVLPQSALFYDRTLRNTGEEVSYKIYPVNAGGVLPEELAVAKRNERRRGVSTPQQGLVTPTDPYRLTDRPHRPYRPANIMVGGKVAMEPAIDDNDTPNDASDDTPKTDDDGNVVMRRVIVGTDYDGLLSAPDTPVGFGNYLRKPRNEQPSLLVSWDNRNRITDTSIADRWQDGNRIPEKNQRTMIEVMWDDKGSPDDNTDSAWRCAKRVIIDAVDDNPIKYPRDFTIVFADLPNTQVINGATKTINYDQMRIRVSSVLINPDLSKDDDGYILHESLYYHDISVTVDGVTGWGRYWGQPWGLNAT